MGYGPSAVLSPPPHFGGTVPELSERFRVYSGRRGATFCPGAGAPMSADVSDLSLVRRVQRGDKGAFDALVLKYQHKLVKLVMRYVRNPAEAEDIAQEAFIKAYRALPQFRGDSAFYTWLYRIAINTAKNAVVSRDRSPVDYELDRHGEENYDMQGRMKDSETPEGLVLTDEIRSTVNAAIDE